MTRTKSLAPVTLLLVEFFFALAVANAQTAGGVFQAWVVSTGMRLNPSSIGTTRGIEARAKAFRNEIVSMQFAVRSNQTLKPFGAACATASGVEALPCSWVEIRYPGYVPMVERGELMAYQSWPGNVWKQPESRWHSGDSFLVYPGKSGPIDSTRWELLRQGIQDYEALEMLQQKIADLRKTPGHAGQAASLERRMKRAVSDTLGLNRCHGVPSPGLSRLAVDGLSAEAEGRPNMRYTSNARIISKHAPKDFLPDGNLDKAVWKTADWVHVDQDMSGTRTYPQSATDIATVWTQHYVYFAYRCKYTTLNIYKDADPAAEKWGLWERDVVEVFLNPQPERLNHYYEFEVSPNNLWIDLEINKDQSPFNDASWDSHFEHATRVDPEHHVWTAEIRIPVASMGAKEIFAGAEWRLNLFRCDGPTKEYPRRYMSWSTIPEGASFHVPTRFGIIRFVR